MSARTLMVNEGMLVELETRIAEIRKTGGELVRAMNGEKVPFPDGMHLLVDYSGSVEVLQEVARALFAAVDLCDPEDNELLRREEEEEEGEDPEDDEDSEDEDDEEDP